MSPDAALLAFWLVVLVLAQLAGAIMDARCVDRRRLRCRRALRACA